MTIRQENKLRMYQAVKGVLTTHEALWKDIPALTRLTTDFNTTLDALIAEGKQQGADTTGVTKAKDELRHIISDNAVAIAGAVYAEASSRGDLDTMGKADYSRTDLLRGAQNETLRNAQLILDLAQKTGKTLDGFGVKPEAITRLQEQITTYTSTMANTREAIVSRHGNTETIMRLVDTLDSNLNDGIDKLMAQFKTTQPLFYRHYISSRIIVDAGTRSETTASTATTA